MADLKWDPACWHDFEAPSLDSSFGDSGSFSYADVPTTGYFRNDMMSYQTGGRIELFLPRSINLAGYDVPANSDSNGVRIFFRKPEACSSNVSWERTMQLYDKYRDLINTHGGAFDYCDMTDPSTWPDDSQKVKDFYREPGNCHMVTDDYPGYRTGRCQTYIVPDFLGNEFGAKCPA